MTRIRVVIAEDDPGLRSELRLLLELDGRVAIVGEAADGAAALATVERVRPDVLLLDLSMPVCDGFAVLRALARRRRAVPAVVLTMHDDPGSVDRALALGAVGYVLKHARADEMIGALDAAASGRSVLDSRIARSLIDRHLKLAVVSSTDRQVSDRQAELLRALGLGLGNKDIASRLGLAEETVKGYLSDLYARIGVSSRAGAVAWAMRHGLID